MQRDYGKEIDEIRGQLSEIKNLLAKAEPQKKETQKPANVSDSNFSDIIANMSNGDSRISALMEELLEKTNNKDHAGAITYMGSHVSGGRQSLWVSKSVDTDQLLSLIESNAAAKVLACIGNNDRLNMLLALLHSPKTAAQLVEQCGYNTTGQVYHHLKPLLAADLVKEDEHQRGAYVIQPHRVQGIIMLLAGISDMLDTRYTQGNWEAK